MVGILYADISETVGELGHVADFIGRYWPLFVVIGALAGALRYLFGKISSMVEKQLDPIKKELAPNGGGSMWDALKRVDSATKDSLEHQHNIYGLISGADARVQALRASNDMPYIEMDAELNHTFVNQAFTKLFGVTYADGSGDTKWESRTHPDDVFKLTELAKRLKEHPQSYVSEARIIDRDDQVIRHTVSYGFPMVGMDGELQGYAASVVVASEEPLDPKYLAALDSSHDGTANWLD